MENKPKYIILHHSYSKDRLGDSWEGIRQYHLSLGWQDVGYHYGIDETAESIYCVRLGRPESMHGAHTKGFNTNSIGICVIGNFDKEFLYNDQVEILIWLLHDLMNRYKIPSTNVIGHRESYKLLGKKVKKSCPGKNFDMDDLRSELT